MVVHDPLPAALLAKLEAAGFRRREPVTMARLTELAEAAGALPEDVVRFLATTDGMDHEDLPLCGSDDMLQPYPSSSLLPLRSDGCGDYDAVFIEPGFGFGAIVFWDHETQRAEYLIASSVSKYLELLVHFPKSERWSADGENQDDFLRLHDPAAVKLLDDSRYPKLVGREFFVEPMPAPGPGEPLPPGARVGINPLTKERIVFMPLPKSRTPPR